MQARTSSAVPGQAGQPAGTILPDKGCAGTHGVRVRPCPVVLNEATKQGIVVSVEGRRVADSKIGGKFAGCFNDEKCYNAQRVSGSRTQWLITSGPACGDALPKFKGLGSHDPRVGFYYVEVSNEYCP